MNVLVKEGILGAILLIMGVFDCLYIDWYWVGRAAPKRGSSPTPRTCCPACRKATEGPDV